MKFRSDDFNAKKERLTWDAVWPLPFESAWSFLTRCMIINHLTVSELIKLVRRCETGGEKIQRIDFLESGWLDFQKLSLLLGVQEQRLREGFLSYFAFPKKSRTSFHYVPRYCKQCLANGYHCVFFDLKAVTFCPWHKTLISTAFPSASKSMDINPAIANSEYSHDQVLEQLAYSFRAGLQPENHDAIRLQCVELISWWEDVTIASEGKVGIFSGMFHGKNLPVHMIDDRSWQLGHAIALAGRDIPWTLDVSPTAARHASFRNDPPITVKQKLEEAAAGIPSCFYKSLRNQIYNRYVRQHRICLRNILSLDRDERCALNADNVCNLALAFFLWRISIEGIGAWERSFTSKTPPSLRLMSPAQAELSHLNRLRWTYYGFFGILSALSTARKGTDIVVTLQTCGVCDGLINACRTPVPSSGTHEEDGPSMHFDLIYPLPELDSKAKICPFNSCKGDALIEKNSYFNQLRFVWSYKSLEQPICRIVSKQGRTKSAMSPLFI